MQILVDLVKIGAIGASLAFLLLSYRLLKQEIGLRDANNNPTQPRPDVLKHISKFRTSALIFLIIGVVSEIVLTNSVDLVRHFFRSELVRVRFNAWEFFPEKNMIAFGFAQDRMNTGLYVLPSEQNKFDVYVAVRAKSGVPYDRGRYDLVFGPYKIETLARQEIGLTAQQHSLLGNACVEFTAFGIEKKTDGADIKAPLDVSSQPLKIVAMHTAHACVGG